MYKDFALVVNGKKFAKGNYVVMNLEDKQIQISLLAITRELGYISEWPNDVEMVVSNGLKTITIDTKKVDFGIYPPCGLDVVVRKKVGNDIILDPPSAILFMSNFDDFKMNIDYVNCSVDVSSSHNLDNAFSGRKFS